MFVVCNWQLIIIDVDIVMASNESSSEPKKA